MELRDALRMLRSETGLTQSELANAINVGYSAESRWENQNTRPNRSSSAAILALAKQRRVSAVCLDALTSILLAPRVADESDKALAKEVSQRMKLEQRELLTSEQLKSVIDNLDLAVIGHRIFSVSADNITVFYHNKMFAEIFGYDDEAEFAKKNDENIYFGIHHESHTAYLKLLTQLLNGEIDFSKFVITISGFKKDGTVIWLEIKGISLTQFSFGYEMFISCRDVTAKVDTERKYAEEVAVRDASLRGYFASFHCDLDDNKVFRHRDTERVTGRLFEDETIDEILGHLAKASHGSAGRDAFRGSLNRRCLLAAYKSGDTFGNVKSFNTVARRWVSVEYILMKNPYTEHVEAAIHIYDIHRQVCAEQMAGIVANRFFEYVGLIDNDEKTFETYYLDDSTIGENVSGKRDYKATCEEKLRLHGNPEDYEAQRKSVSLATIRKKLNESTFYTIVLKLKDRGGRIRYKRVTYTYMDDTKAMIVMAQSDRENIVSTLKGGAVVPDEAYETRQLK